jgi:hypothetical protein
MTTGPSEASRLSDVQVEMLLFFAERRDTPCGDTRTTGALIARGLLDLADDSSRYRITRLGRQVAAHFDQ